MMLVLRPSCDGLRNGFSSLSFNTMSDSHTRGSESGTIHTKSRREKMGEDDQSPGMRRRLQRLCCEAHNFNSSRAAISVRRNCGARHAAEVT
jgi:hypothetical protein